MYANKIPTGDQLLWTGASILGALLVLTLAAGCQSSSSDAAPSVEETAQKSDAIPVETLTVQAVDFDQTFEIPATIEALQEVTVAAESGGRILSAPFEEGDEVRAGSRLLQVDVEIDSTQIRLLENQLEHARREYERTKTLEEEGLATPQQLDQAETALENARLNLQQAKVGASKGGVSSPMSGQVIEKFVEKGEFASPGAPVATIAEIDQVIVKGHVPESQVRHVRRGDTAQVYIPALDETRQGQITRRGLKASARTGTYVIEVTLDNPDHAILPGMSGRIQLVQKRWEQAIVVPREAILQGFARSEAMVFPSGETEARAELRVVELGPSTGPNVLITSGLTRAEHLIVRGHRRLVDGARARRVRHFDSIEQMRTAGASLNLGAQGAPASEADSADSDADGSAEDDSQ